MARAITLALLLGEPSDEAAEKDIIKFITEFSNFDKSLDSRLLMQARKLIGDTFPENPPRILDPFSGGGALPFEALRVGADVDALELNPVAYILLLCTLDYPIRLKNRRESDGLSNRSALSYWVERGAAQLRRQVEVELTELYEVPSGSPPANAYIWARTLTCTNPACRVEIPLLSSRWLDDHQGRKRGFNLDATGREIRLTIATGPAIQGDPSIGTVRRVTVACPKCGSTIDRATLRSIGTSSGYGERLIAIVEAGSGGLVYREPRDEDFLAAQKAQDVLSSLEMVDGVAPFPDEDIPYSNLQVPYVYGFSNWSNYFNPRQKVLISRLSQGVRAIYEDIVNSQADEELARAVATYLGLIVNRIADRNSAFASWDASRQTIRSTFARQGISNVWDYAESSPFGAGSGSWDQAVNWVTRVIEHCEISADKPAKVVQGSAMHLPYGNDTFDAIITDPPYYDSVQYGDLSDFFYVWLKRSIGFLYPAQFATPQTPKGEEIVSKRLGKNRPGAVMADEYERRLSAAFREMRRVVKPEGVAAVIFAHTSTTAWEALIRTMIDSEWIVTTSWPIRSEMAARSRAIGQPSLASSVCLVCRPRELQEVGYFDDVRRALEARVRGRLAEFWDSGISGADFFISGIGPAIEVFGQYKEVVKLSGSLVGVDEMLALTQQIVADFTLTRLLAQDAVGAIDEITRFYLLWRWMFGKSAAPADEAYKLAHAFGVELDRMRGRRYLIQKSGDQVTILGPRERAESLKQGVEVDRSDPYIDVLHRALLLWEAGRRNELAQLLGGYGVDQDPAFWAVAQVLAELPSEDDDPERMLAQGLTGSRASLTENASRHRGAEQMTLDF